MGMESDNATGYASSSSSTPTGIPCYDNASLVTAEVLIRTTTQSENVVIHMFLSCKILMLSCKMC